VGKKNVPRTDVTNNYILRILAFGDKKLNQQIENVWGRFRDTPAELNALINKMRGQLYEGRSSFDRGKIVFDNQCAKCHKFDGRGAEVGPNLDGAARDIEYLLVNVLDPNRVVGQPYYMRTVALKNGRIETGILVAEDDNSITLKSENDVVKAILRKDIDRIRTQEKSIMPEGLANNMSAQDFRDLIRYTMAHPFLTEVSVAGPWPEKTDPPKKPSWKRPAVGAPGRIPLPMATNTGKQVAFVAAEVTTPSPFRTRLQFGAVHPLRVLLNGKEVYRGKPGTGQAAPDQAGVEVDLQKGLNRLLFQVTYQGDNEVLYARLLDPERRLRYPEAEK
jgi:putative heme-binding domain-containing protein